jgi:hypothetical protein
MAVLFNSSERFGRFGLCVVLLSTFQSDDAETLERPTPNFVHITHKDRNPLGFERLQVRSQIRCGVVKIVA